MQINLETLQKVWFTFKKKQQVSQVFFSFWGISSKFEIIWWFSSKMAKKGFEIYWTKYTLILNEWKKWFSDLRVQSVLFGLGLPYYIESTENPLFRCFVLSFFNLKVSSLSVGWIVTSRITNKWIRLGVPLVEYGDLSEEAHKNLWINFSGNKYRRGPISSK